MDRGWVEVCSPARSATRTPDSPDAINRPGFLDVEADRLPLQRRCCVHQLADGVEDCFNCDRFASETLATTIDDRFPAPLEVRDCDVKSIISSAVRRNTKSGGNRSALQLIA